MGFGGSEFAVIHRFNAIKRRLYCAFTLRFVMGNDLQILMSYRISTVSNRPLSVRAVDCEWSRRRGDCDSIPDEEEQFFRNGCE